MLFFKDLYAAMSVDAAGYKFLDKRSPERPLRSRWSIVIDGPTDSEDDSHTTIDTAMKGTK